MDEMLSEITPEEFDEWMAMDRIIPFGDEKLAWVMALGFCVLANRMGSALTWMGAKDVKDFSPADFIPWQKRKKKKAKPVSPQVLTNLLKQRIAATGN